MKNKIRAGWALAIAVHVATANANAASPPAATTAPKAAKPAPECFAALRQPPGPRLLCEHKTWMTEAERADFAKLTRGYLLDAHCTVTVDIERRIVDEAMVASDRVFDAPPQPVTCELQTSGGPMKVGGTFAPHVVFKEGFAVDASPGLANITGVNSYLAMPIVAYVNRAASIKSEMSAIINALRARANSRQAAR